MALLDINELKNKIKSDGINNVTKILETLKCHQIWYTTDEVRCASPNGTNKTELVVNLDNLFCRMYLSNEIWKGDIFALIQHISEPQITFMQSVNLVLNLLGLSKDNIGKVKQVQSNDVLDIFAKARSQTNCKSINDLEIQEEPLSILDEYLITPTTELLSEIILPSTQRLFKTGIDQRLSRIIFPHFNYNSTQSIVGITGRTLASNEEINILNIPKYWNYIKGYKKMANLYGFSHSIPNVEKSKMLIIHEGEKSVLKHFTNTGDKGFSCSVGGHEISDYQIEIINKYTPIDCEIVIAFDKDVMDLSGKQFFKDITNRINPYRKCSYIWDENNLLDKKDAPIDKGFEVFNTLLEQRIR